jgi:hypothetical protein
MKAAGFGATVVGAYFAVGGFACRSPPLPEVRPGNGEEAKRRSIHHRRAHP